MERLSLRAEAGSSKLPSESREVPAETVLQEKSRVLRSEGLDKHFSIVREHKPRHRSTVKREQKLEELRGQLVKSSSEDDDDLLDNDVFLAVKPVLQGNLTHAAAVEQRPVESAQSLLESRRVEADGSSTLPTQPAGQVTASVVRDQASADVSVPVTSTLAQQQQQPVQQPPIIGQVQQPNNLDLLAVPQQAEEGTEMSEDEQIVPSQFKGKTGENAEDWLRHFENYSAYRGLDEPKKLALFKVLMTELAGDWLASLADDVLVDYGRVKAAFEARYSLSEMIKYRSAKEVFARKQLDGEPVDEYITKIQKAARMIGA